MFSKILDSVFVVCYVQCLGVDVNENVIINYHILRQRSMRRNQFYFSKDQQGFSQIKFWYFMEAAQLDAFFAPNMLGIRGKYMGRM
jgi:hypothetical protein